MPGLVSEAIKSNLEIFSSTTMMIELFINRSEAIVRETDRGVDNGDEPGHLTRQFLVLLLEHVQRPLQFLLHVGAVGRTDVQLHLRVT